MGREDPLEEGMAMHSSTLACRISLTAEPGLGGAEQGHSKHVMVGLLGIAHTLALAGSSNGCVAPLE